MPFSRAGCTLLIAALGASATCSCGRKPGPARPSSGTPQRPPRAAPIDPARITGHWQWSHREDVEGVRRIENERWELRLEKDTLQGTYDREVTFISLDGTPFECSQALTYRLVTSYEVIGTVDSRHFDVAERAYTALPSPCERGFRRLGEYRGSLVDGNLVLEWQGGRQTLTRSAAARDRSARAHSAAGPWRWRNRAPGRNGTARVESEEWELTEAGDGALSGTFLRTVTVFDPDGAVFDCAGDTYYQFRDRYTVRGRRAGDRIRLNEIEVDAGRHPCLVYTERHLDSATGTVGDGFLQLEWRGRYRQVLHRPDPRPAIDN